MEPARRPTSARGLGDPIWFWLALSLAIVLLLTTTLGFLWRHGLGGSGRLGRLATGASVSVSVLALVAAGIVAALVASRLGLDYLFDQPQPRLQAVLLMVDVDPVISAVGPASVWALWRTPEWPLLRLLHHAT